MKLALDADDPARARPHREHRLAGRASSALPGGATYSATKPAVIGLSRGGARGAAADGRAHRAQLRACPVVVNTELGSGLGRGAPAVCRKLEPRRSRRRDRRGAAGAGTFDVWVPKRAKRTERISARCCRSLPGGPVPGDEAPTACLAGADAATRGPAMRCARRARSPGSRPPPSRRRSPRRRSRARPAPIERRSRRARRHARSRPRPHRLGSRPMHTAAVQLAPVLAAEKSKVPFYVVGRAAGRVGAHRLARPRAAQTRLPQQPRPVSGR